MRAFFVSFLYNKNICVPLTKSSANCRVNLCQSFIFLIMHPISRPIQKDARGKEKLKEIFF